jgi:hypothetical protein
MSGVSAGDRIATAIVLLLTAIAVGLVSLAMKQGSRTPLKQA